MKSNSEWAKWVEEDRQRHNEFSKHKFAGSAKMSDQDRKKHKVQPAAKDVEKPEEGEQTEEED